MLMLCRGRPRGRYGILLALAVVAMQLGYQGTATASVQPEFFGLYSEDAYRPTPDWRDDIFRAQADAGAGLVRLPFDWSVIEPEPGAWHIDELDGFMIAAARAHTAVLPTLVGTPDWASSAPARSVKRGQYPPAHLADLKAYARMLVERYGPGGIFWLAHPELDPQPVKAWQVWNEPNIPFFWPDGPNPAEYTDMLIAAGDAIHAADPAALVVSAGITTSRMGLSLKEFIDGMYRAGAAGHFDILGVHPYATDAAETIKRLTEARALMDAYGDDSPMWATEFGWASGGDASEHTLDEAGQARELDAALRQMVARRASLKLRGAIYYNWRDSISSSPGLGTWPAHAGLLRIDNTRKPAYYAFRRVALDLADAAAAQQAPPLSASPVDGATAAGPGAATPSPPPRPLVRVSSARVVKVRGGRVRLRLSCSSPGAETRCAGGVRLEHRHGRRGAIVVGRRHYELRDGARIVLRLKLTSRGRRMLARSRRLPVRALFVGTAVDRQRLPLTLRR